MLTKIVECMLSKLRWSQQPALNHWAAKYSGQNHVSPEQPKPQASQQYKQFMFNPAKLSHQDITRLNAICAKGQRSMMRHESKQGLPMNG